MRCGIICFLFFFQAEDGIRDLIVTGVQTCALPIYLFYYGTGNPGTWNPDQRPGENKWSMTIFARNPDNGEAKRAYQMTPHDEWDYDGVNEMVLADLTIAGKPVKALAHFARNGFGY